MRITGTIQIIGVNPYILVSAAQAQQIAPGQKRPIPVTVQINGQPTPPWHINMMPVGDGTFYLYLHGDVRKASHTKVGDVVQADVELDTTYTGGPAHAMPPRFAEALAANAVIKTNWEALPPSRQKEILRYFASLKSSQAVDRNITKALQMLGGEAGRFMARSWKDGR